jgi:hypothetical protein
MLTQLATIKSRLAILDTDTTNDSLLTNALKAVSARFDRECNRTLARAENFIQEFPADALEVSLACYPVETFARFELKRTESEGWVEQTDIEYLVRRQCVVSLAAPLGNSREQARVLYTGGYVLPGVVPQPGQTPLPPELEHAAVEQVAYWFQNRDRIGLKRIWEYHATYRDFADLDLLTAVRDVLAKHTRWTC